MNYIEFFKKYTKNSQNQIAIIHNKEKITYKELDTLSSKIADKLRKIGAKKGDFIAVLLPRSIEYVASYLGILKAGMVVVPLSTKYPQQRVDFIQKDCNATALIDESFFTDIDEFDEFLDLASDEAPALLYYTSGSTGAPKGVLHSIKSLENKMLRTMPNLKDLENKSFANMFEFSFTAFADILCLLCLKTSIHIISDEIKLDTKLLQKYFKKHDIYAATLAPSLLALFDEKPALSVIYAVGERLSNVYFDEICLYSFYGMTETLGLVSYFKLDKSYENTPVGCGVCDTKLFIMDEKGCELSDGNIGEIVICADFDTKYFKDDEKTAKSFVKKGDKTLFFSGDLGYKNKNGDVVLTGRKDWMVKIHGQRVEIFEIESALKAIKGVKECAIKAFGDMDKCLVGFVVANVSENEIKAHLAKKLPTYMIPQDIVFMDALPKNINGKIDRNKLSWNSPNENSKIPSKKITNENELCNLFASVLGKEYVDENDDFSALGGDSLSAAKIAAKSTNLSASMILAHKTPKNIIKALKEQKPLKEAKSNECDLNPSALGVYLAHKNDEITYNIPFYIKLPKNVDIAKFKEALNKAFLLHKIFCVKIHEAKMLYQKSDMKLEFCQNNDINSFLKDFIKPFDLANDDLYRFCILKCANDEYYFVADIHHTIFDGNSLKVFLNDLADIYNGKKITKKPELKAFSPEFFELIKKRQNDSFKQNIENINSAFISDIYDENKNSQFVLNKKLEFQSEIYEFLKREKITADSLFSSIFAQCLCKFNGENECEILLSNHGRHHRDLDDAVGMFVETFGVHYEMGDLNALIAQKNEQLAHSSYLATLNTSNIKVAFVYQNELFDDIALGDEMVGICCVDVEYKDKELVLMVCEQNGAFELKLFYNNQKYSKYLIECFCEYFCAVLKSIIKKQDLKILPNDENFKQIPFTSTILDDFARFKNSDKIAIVDNSTKLTYKELDKLSDNVASWLLENGAKKGEVAGILTKRNANFIIYALGALKAGCAYMPLDTSYPDERLNTMIQTAKCRILLCQKELKNRLDFKGKILSEIPKNSKNSRILEFPKISLDDSFCVLFTSGTTGTPKGIDITHKNVKALCVWGADQKLDIITHKHANFASFGFDAHLFDFYFALGHGKCVHIIDEDTRLDLNALKNYFEKHKINSSCMTTQVAFEFSKITPKHLKVILTGGEILPPLSVPKTLRLYNSYGPAECAMMVSNFQITKKLNFNPIGKPNPNTKIYLLDKLGRLAPKGALGEICVAGAQVSRGYINNAKKTALSFTPNNIEKIQGFETLYHTGDIARILENGDLQIIGRADKQVKIRGYRIELSEIEGIISEFSAIKENRVITKTASNGAKYLVAYVVSDEQIDINALKEFIAKSKPRYMVPSFVIQIPRIPLTQNHKLDINALPNPLSATKEVLAPKNATEARIYDILKGILHNEHFSTNDDFFDIGLNSISAMRLGIELSKEFNTKISFHLLATNPSVQKLANIIKKSQNVSSNEKRKHYPLAKNQLGIYAQCAMNPTLTNYNIPLLMKLPSSIDINNFKNAIKSAFEAHPYLKAQLVRGVNGDILMRRDDDLEVIISEKTLENIDKNELIKPFELYSKPLYKIQILHKTNENYLFIDIHHIICDGYSLNILFADIDKAYKGEALAPETYTGYDIALDEESRQNSDEFEHAKEFYKELLSGRDIDSLPVKDSQKNTNKVEYVEKTSRIDFARILEFCALNKISKNIFFNAVFAYTLAKFNASDEVLYTTIHNGRFDVRTLGCVSMLVKTFVMPVDIDESDKCVDFMRKIAALFLNNMSNEIYSFSHISHEYNIYSDIIFDFDDESYELSIKDTKLRKEKILLNALKSKLEVIVNVKNSKLNFSIGFNANYYTKYLMNCFISLFEQVAMEFCQKDFLKQIELVKDKNEALGATNEIPFKSTILDDFASFKNSDKIAIVDNSTKLTYKELDKLSDNVASWLLENGAKKGEVAGILTKRNANFIIYALGALKAGCAYMPLDTSYPDERLNTMIQTAKCRILLCQKELKNRLDFKGKILSEIPKNSKNSRILEFPKISLDDSFCVLFTSGTTGTPKGIDITHKNVKALCVWMSTQKTWIQCAKHASYASFGFDAHLLDFYFALTNHKTLYIIDDEMRLDIDAIRAYFERESIESAFMTTQVAFEFSKIAPKCLKVLLTGGEALAPLSPAAHVELHNIYGPSECTTLVTQSIIDKKLNFNPIGKPNPNTKIYLLDKLGRLAPKGALGEICVAGAQVSRGYINNAKKSALSFTPNNIEKIQGFETLYHTGDIARILESGDLQIIGRADKQVKIRGYRIELSEIESVIAEFQSIKENRVIAKTASNSAKYLVAYVVSDEQINTHELKEFIAKSKPRYMVPSFVIQIPKIPLTQNHKLDIKALPEPLSEQKNLSMPTNRLENKLYDILGEVLEHKNFGIDDNIFDVGLNSVLASKFLIKCLNINIKLNYKDIFAHQSIKEIAQFLDSKIEITLEENKSEKILSNNVYNAKNQVSKSDLGVVLVAGANGFLGIHIVKELLDNGNKVIAMVRSKDGKSGEERFKEYLEFYFGKSDFKGLKVIEEDIINVRNLSVKFDTLINAAASVKHFSSDDSIERINVISAQNAIKLCQKHGAKLIELSTISVAGMSYNENKAQVFRENHLKIGQWLNDNQYLKSKLKAEEIVLEAMKNGLRAKIIRVGNLMGRYSDGKFQINVSENSFTGRFRAYATIGCFPMSRAGEMVEFSPVDSSAKAVVLLSASDDKYTLFHAFNQNRIPVWKAFSILNKKGIDVDLVNDEKYELRLDKVRYDEAKMESIKELFAYNSGVSCIPNEINADFTTDILAKMGFAWQEVNEAYFERFLKAVKNELFKVKF